MGLDRYIVSAGEYTVPITPYNRTIKGTDRTAGAGFAHLIAFSGDGTRIADATLTERGVVEYHNDGVDLDGEVIWTTVAQYRPNSTAYVYRSQPETLVPRTVVRYDDHLGGIVHDGSRDSIMGLSWGSRKAST